MEKLFSITIDDVRQNGGTVCENLLEAPEVPQKDYSEPDFLTPFRNGVHWTFEPLKNSFPKTYKSLVKETRFFLITYNHLKGNPYELVLEHKRGLIKVGRRSLGHNPSDESYKPEHDSLKALPKEIMQAFYNRFDGLGVVRRLGYELFDFLLPLSRSTTRSFDEMAERYNLHSNELYLKMQSRFPISKRTPDAHTFFFMSAFLSTHADNPEEPETRLNGDYLFVKHHIHDNEIYHIKDGDYENMKVLDNYVEAIDRYCEHILEERPGRFDFLPYTKPFDWN